MTASVRTTDQARLTNEHSHPITVIVMPWAAEQVLAPGAEIIVRAEGPPGDHAELLIERTCDTVTVWTWAGAEVCILTADGRLLIEPRRPHRSAHGPTRSTDGGATA